ncbi:MAG: hypothetical protein GTO41_06915, partial [Burkholderiales bacterium]|nr:hypothetical protein [Burkholderiales bacterium]
MDNRSHYRVFFVAALLAAATVVADHGWTQTKLPRLGILTNGTAEDPYVGGLRWEGIVSALAKLGWIEGQNIEFDIRSAAGDLTRFAELAADLVKAKPDVIWADSAPALRAAYAATHTIPILARDFTNDPVAAGYAENYYRPGKNVTGVFMDAPQFAVKWIELLRAIIPELASIAVLWDPSPGDAHLRALEQVAPGLGIELQVIEVHSPEDIDVAASAIKTGSQALITL